MVKQKTLYLSVSSNFSVSSVGLCETKTIAITSTVRLPLRLSDHEHEAGRDESHLYPSIEANMENSHKMYGINARVDV